MANIITSIRILLSAVLLFFPVFSPAFYAVYLTSGFTDLIDGAVARKTNTVSEFGSRLDTIADIVFVAVCLIKLLPVLNTPIWLYIWIAVIAFIRVTNIAAGYIRQKMFMAVHSIINKMTGGLLFIFPLTSARIKIVHFKQTNDMSRKPSARNERSEWRALGFGA